MVALLSTKYVDHRHEDIDPLMISNRLRVLRQLNQTVDAYLVAYAVARVISEKVGRNVRIREAQMTSNVRLAPKPPGSFDPYRLCINYIYL